MNLREEERKDDRKACLLRFPPCPLFSSHTNTHTHHTVFVEALDKCFENVCELDLIFHSDKVRWRVE